MIFLNSLFGYLSLLIIIKWCTGSQADLYHVMIYMFLSPTEELGENELFWGQRPLQARFPPFFILCSLFYIGSLFLPTHLRTHTRYYNLQIMLLLLAFIAVPWMLFPKPFALRKIHMEVGFHSKWFIHSSFGLIKGMKCFCRGFKVALMGFSVLLRWISM